MNKSVIVLCLLISFLFACNEKPATEQKKSTPKKHLPKAIPNEQEIAQNKKQAIAITYELLSAKEWLLKYKNDSSKQSIAFALNRTDKSNFAHMDSVIIPTDLDYDLAIYMPFPLYVANLSAINKILFFSYSTQTFAAYEKGMLIHTGPTSMGRENRLTPTGLYFANWKAEVTTSTVNDEWILNWNFNVLNLDGIGWHQYSLPGYPASHSCLRLQEKDAQFLYNWADQWILEDAYTLLAKGTPVIIFGQYDFKSPKPWLQLLSNSHALDIEAKEIEAIVQPNMITILNAQKHRDSVQMQKGLE